jgi:hypothetical protein
VRMQRRWHRCCARTTGMARSDMGELRTRGRSERERVRTGLYPRPWRRAAPPRSANSSKALCDTDDDKWALCVSDFPISLNSKIDHSLGKNSQARRKNLEKSWRYEIHFGTVFIIDTSSKSSQILNYFKDSESKLV